LVSIGPLVSIDKKDEKIRVVAAVVERNGHFLVCQRPAHKRHGGLWEFPGGKLEASETVEGAARRELAEELGVSIRSCGEQLFVIGDPDSPFVIEFHPVEIQGEPVCLEHTALAWVTVPAMLSLNLAPSDRCFARFLQEMGSTGG
jgi:mutator protein MutT